MNSTFKRRAMRTVTAFGAALLLVPTTRLAAQEPSGPTVWAANCGNCHRLRSVETYTASQWNTIATHMGLVARLTGPEKRAVREFLVNSARAREGAATARLLAPDLAGVPAIGTSGGAKGGAAISGQSPGATPRSGRDLFRANCMPCHGAQGRGDGPAAAALNPRPVNFADPAQRQVTADSAVRDIIAGGRRSMPAFGRALTPEQLDSLTAYVKSLSR